jgi:internalin A
MPKRPSKQPKRNPATEEALRRIEKARESGARSLDLSDLKLSTLPEVIGQLSQLSQLQLLDLSGNQPSTLPEVIGQLSQLRTLYLRYNRLSTLPEAIGQLSRLHELNLFNNRLSTLPEAIGQLSQLQKLKFDGNQLSALPKAIGQLSQLKELNLGHNQLSSLPPEIVKLTSLQSLNLSANQLSSLPEAVQSLERLEKLFLHGNPGLGLPDEVLGPTFEEVFGSQKRSPKPAREILDYYFATRGAKGLALREVKLIVVGWGKAGKTTLVKRLAGEPMDPNEPETHGIMIRPLTLHCTGWGASGAGVGLRRAACAARDARVFPHDAQPLSAGARAAQRPGGDRREILASTHPQLRRISAGGRGAKQEPRRGTSA